MLAAALTRWLTHVKIQGSRSTRLGESAAPHRCHHSSATSSCRIWTRPPTLHESACSTVILAPQPLQAAGISSGEWLYLRRMLSLHLSANRPVPFNRFGNTDSQAPAAQFHFPFVPSYCRGVIPTSSLSLLSYVGKLFACPRSTQTWVV